MTYSYSTTSRTLAPVITGSYDIFMIMPEPTISKFYFLSVFSNNLWICITMGIGLAILILIIHHKMFKIGASTIVNSVMDTLGITSSKELLILPSKCSLNIIKVITSILCFFVGISLSAFLIAELATIKNKFPFTDLDTFWKQNQYAMCIPPDDISYDRLLHHDPDGRLLNSKACEKFVEKIYQKNVPIPEIFCEIKPPAVFVTTTSYMEWYEQDYTEKERYTLF